MRQIDSFEKQRLKGIDDYSDAQLLSLPDKKAALLLTINSSGLEDKEIYSPLGIDKAQFSRIRSGQMNFPIEKEDALMTLCGNEILLRWSALTRGYDLVPRRSSLERERDEALADAAEARRELEIAKRLFKEMRA